MFALRPRLDLRTILAVECLFLGTILFFDPDLFLNPKDGWCKVICGILKTNLETNHLDPVMSRVSQLKGAGFLTMTAMLFMIRDETSRIDVFFTSFYLHGIMAGVYMNAVFSDSCAENDKFIKPPLVAFYGGIFFVLSLWSLTELGRGEQKSRSTPTADEQKQKQDSSKSWVRNVCLVTQILLVAPFNVLDIVDPHHVDPGKKPVSFWLKTTLPDNTKDPLSVIQSQASGAFGLAFSLVLFQRLLFDRSNQRLHWWTQCSIVAHALYLSVYLRALLDDTGYVYKPAWLTVAFVTAVLGTVQVANLRALFHLNGKSPKKEQRRKQKSPQEANEAPALHTESSQWTQPSAGKQKVQ